MQRQLGPRQLGPLRRALQRGLLVLLGLIALGAANVNAQTSYASFTTGAWNTARWNNSADASPYDSLYTTGNAVHFTQSTLNGYTFAGMGSAVDVGNIFVNDNVKVSFSSASGTFGTNGTILTVSTGLAGSFDFGSQAISTESGTGFRKTGIGVLNMRGGGTFSGGFTLNQGAVFVSGDNALGQGGALNLNGGAILVNDGNSRNFSGKFSSINIGGTVQFGDVNTGQGNMTFSDVVNLAPGANLSIGYSRTVTMAGVISNTTGSGGIVFSGTGGGRFEITNTANTFSGPIQINNGGGVRFTSDGSMGDASNKIIIDGGRLSTIGADYTIAATRDIQVGNAPTPPIAGSTIFVESGTTTYDGVISNKSGTNGAWTKHGSGTLVLGGVSTYTGRTTIYQGTIRLNGENRLPTTTVVAFGEQGQFATNVGTLNLNGFNQTIAGLNSNLSGTAGSALNNNTVTSTAAANLTLGGSGTYVYGDGTNRNSGIITGAISIVKTGTGTQTFGDSNTYSGTTSINGGALRIRHATGLGGTGSGTSVAAGAALQLQAGVTVTGTAATGVAIGNEALTLNGTGINNTGALRSLSGVNTYAGLVTLGSDSRINTDAGSLSLTNTGTITGSGANLTVGGAGDTTIASVIGTGSGSLSKDGSGTLTLSAANTFSGGVTVTAGTVNVTGSLAQQNFNVASGASLTSSSALQASGNNNINGTVNAAFNLQSGATISGSGTINGDLTISGALAPGNSIGTLNNVGNLTWNGDGSDWVFELGPGETSDLLNITGDFNKGTGSLFRFDFGGSTEAGTFKLVDWTNSTTFAETDFSYVGLGGGNLGSFSFSGNQLNFTVIVTAVPEPSSMFLLGMASVFGLAARYRRKTATR